MERRRTAPSHHGGRGTGFVQKTGRYDEVIALCAHADLPREQDELWGKSLESHQTLNVEGEWKPEPRHLGAGALFVPIAQPKAQLVMTLLEPKAPDSLLAWGFFNNAFEQKEYMEAYVAEDIAREQLKSDPKLAAEFQQKLKSDEAFAKDPTARLDFFYRRHPSWDERLGLYPVMRTDGNPLTATYHSTLAVGSLTGPCLMEVCPKNSSEGPVRVQDKPATKLW
jgi:hypothetical protein